MDVLCAQCETVYELDDALVPPKGRRVKCTTCGAVFRAFPPSTVDLSHVPTRSETVELELGRTQVTSNPLDVTVRGPFPEPPVEDEEQKVAPTPLFEPPLENVAEGEWAAPVAESSEDNSPAEITKTWTKPAPVEPALVEPALVEALSPRPTAPEIRVPQPETRLSPVPEDFSPSFESDAPLSKSAPRRSTFEDTAALQATIQAAGRKSLWKIALILILLSGAGYLFYVQLWPRVGTDSLRSLKPAEVTPKVVAQEVPVSVDAGKTVAEEVAPAAEAEKNAEAVAIVDSGVVMDAGALAVEVPGVADELLPEAPPLHLSLRLVGIEKLPKNNATPKTFAAFLAAGEQKRFDLNYKLALQHYSKAAGLASHRVEPLVGRGLAYLGLGKPAEAEASFVRALKVNKKYVPAMLGLAESYRLRGKTQLATKQFQKCLEAASDGPEADTARQALAALRKP